MYDMIIKTARDFPDKSTYEVLEIAEKRYDRSKNPPCPNWGVPNYVRVFGGFTQENGKAIPWFTWENWGG